MRSRGNYQNSDNQSGIDEKIYSKVAIIRWNQNIIQLKTPRSTSNKTCDWFIDLKSKKKQCQIFKKTIYFSNLEYIVFSYADLKRLNQINAPKLKQIYFIQTILEQISEQFCLQLFPELQVFQLVHSNIKIFPKLNAPKLKYFKISKSEISSTVALDNYPILISINLDSNEKLFSLNQSSTKTFPELQVIRCCGCKIKIIPKFDTPKLKQIYAFDNQLQRIEQFLKGDYPNLIQIDFSKNKIQSSEQFGYRNYNKLKKLNLSNNNLSTITKINAVNLQVLNLSCNMISKIDDQFFKDKYKLIQLKLNDNQIQTNAIQCLNNNTIVNTNINNFNSSLIVPLMSLEGQKNNSNIFIKLQQIHLHGNKITNLEFFGNIDLSLTEKIDLSDNQITTFQIFSKIKIPMVQNLKLYFNFNLTVDNLCRTQIFQTLKQGVEAKKSKQIYLQINKCYFSYDRTKNTINNKSFVFKLQKTDQNMKHQHFKFDIGDNIEVDRKKKFIKAFANKWGIYQDFRQI